MRSALRRIKTVVRNTRYTVKTIQHLFRSIKSKMMKQKIIICTERLRDDGVIEPGQMFNEYEDLGDYVRLYFERKSELDYLTYDVRKATFKECFQVPRFRTVWVISYGTLTHGIKPVNEAARLMMPHYHDLVCHRIS